MAAACLPHQLPMAEGPPSRPARAELSVASPDGRPMPHLLSDAGHKRGVERQLGSGGGAACLQPPGGRRTTMVVGAGDSAASVAAPRPANVAPGLGNDHAGGLLAAADVAQLWPGSARLSWVCSQLTRIVLN